MLFHLRPTDRVTYVIAQHMANDGHSRLMASLLNRSSQLPVVEATADERLLPDHVYLIPAGRDGMIRKGTIRLVPPRGENLSTPSVNVLFSSLAEDSGRHAVGIVLSGTGSDGTAGCRSIKAQGGRTFAQAPASAVYDGMPTAAIDAGVIDRVCPETDLFDAIVAALPDVAGRGHGSPASGMRPPMPAPPATGAQPHLGRLVRLVHEASGIDFSGYKEETLLRRLEKRMSVLGILSLRDYLTHVSRTPEELHTIRQLFLVSVSSFFRDHESFRALETELKALLSTGTLGHRIRFWVAGCATGEEVYGLAILLTEMLGERLQRHDVAVTGTDLNPEALDTAARGRYGEAAFREMDAAWQHRYFAAEGGQWRVGDQIRRLCRFEHGDVISAEPVEPQDLISCRNLLIYLKSGLQNQLIQKFHRALQPHGLLFLGQSESLAPLGSSLFKPVDATHRLYRRR